MHTLIGNTNEIYLTVDGGNLVPVTDVQICPSTTHPLRPPDLILKYEGMYAPLYVMIGFPSPQAEELNNVKLGGDRGGPYMGKGLIKASAQHGVVQGFFHPL